MVAHSASAAPTQKMQHLDGKFHWLREQAVDDRTLRLVHVPTADQAADFLTKACPRALVRKFRGALDGSAPLQLPSLTSSGSLGASLHGRSPFSSVTSQSP